MLLARVISNCEWIAWVGFGCFQLNWYSALWSLTLNVLGWVITSSQWLTDLTGASKKARVTEMVPVEDNDEEDDEEDNDDAESRGDQSPPPPSQEYKWFKTAPSWITEVFPWWWYDWISEVVKCWKVLSIFVYLCISSFQLLDFCAGKLFHCIFVLSLYLALSDTSCSTVWLLAQRCFSAFSFCISTVVFS